MLNQALAGDSLLHLKRDVARRLGETRFRLLPAEQLRRVMEGFEPVACAAGDYVVRQGDIGDYYYAIGAGRCVVERQDGPVAVPRALATLGPGEAFGEEALLSGRGRNASVRMLVDGTLLRLPRALFNEALRKPLLHGIELPEAEERVAAGGRWIDLRQPETNTAGRRPGALPLPLLQLRSLAGSLPRERRYVVYCETGVRSQVGAFLLAERGFDVCYLNGGLRRHGLLPGRDDPARRVAPLPISHREEGHVACPVGRANPHAEAEVRAFEAELDALRETQRGAGLSREAWLASRQASEEARRLAARDHAQQLLAELASFTGEE